MANSVTFPVGLGGSGITIDDSSNPGVGLGNGGHKTLFVPALSQTVIMAQTAVTSATNASSYMATTNGYMGTTLGYQNAASASATLAQNWATQLVTPVSGGEYSAKYWAQQSAASAAASAMVTFTDNFAVVKGTADNTKQVKFDVSTLISTGTTRTISVPNKNGTMALTTDTGVALIAGPFTTTAVANADFLNVFTSDYDKYTIVIDRPQCANSSSLNLRFANAGVVDSGGAYGTAFVNGTSISGTNITTTSGVGPLINTGVLAGTVGITINNANSASSLKTAEWLSMVGSGTGTYDAANRITIYTGANVVSGFRLFWGAGGNFAAGATIRVYGWKNA